MAILNGLPINTVFIEHEGDVDSPQQSACHHYRAGHTPVKRFKSSKPGQTMTLFPVHGRNLILGLPALPVLCFAFAATATATASETEPIQALMITGGGWHDYEAQQHILAEGISARANVQWTIDLEGMEGGNQEQSRHKPRRQRESGWAEGFDVALYNMCYSNVTDVEFIEGITRVHEAGLPAVVLHCAMHSYRHAETEAWRDLLGVRTTRHEAHRPFTVENLKPDHPVMKGFPEEWETPRGELYMIEEVREGVTLLGRAFGVDTEEHHLTIWTNQYGEGRIFGTTIGHHNETMEAEEYLDLVARGLLWSVGKLRDDGTPEEGYGSADHSFRRLVLVAGAPSHGRGTHEHNAGVRLLKDCLEHVSGLEVVAHYNGWPEDPGAFDAADGILLYMDGGGRHPVIQGERLETMQALMEEGLGLAAFHYATEVPVERGGPQFVDWIGGHYETHYSVNPIWKAEFNDLPGHPITRGVEPFSIRDEWYFNIRFREGMEGITPILRAKPSDETRDGPYVSPQGPYPHIVEAKGETETLAWAVERVDGGRGFGFTGGHFHENWGDENFRKVALNALVWITGAEVPEEGVTCSVSDDYLEKHLD